MKYSQVYVVHSKRETDTNFRSMLFRAATVWNKETKISSLVLPTSWEFNLVVFIAMTSKYTVIYVGITAVLDCHLLMLYYLPDKSFKSLVSLNIVFRTHNFAWMFFGCRQIQQCSLFIKGCWKAFDHPSHFTN